MTDLSIDRLTLQITNGRGQEHRVHDIAARAAVLIGERLVALDRSGPGMGSREMGSLAPEPVAVDLAHSDNESCARAVAEQVVAAIRLQVEG